MPSRGADGTAVRAWMGVAFLGAEVSSDDIVD
jgi:hypothetical protein